MQATDRVQTVPRARPVVHPYAQIAAHFRARIRAGKLKPGDPLPSIAAIALEWGMSAPTAQRAVNVLKQEGLVRAEHGRGTFVVSVLPP